MQIAFLLYDGLTALDAIGPYDVLNRLPGAEVVFVAQRSGPVTTEAGSLSLIATHSLEQVPAPEILVIPGGYGNRALLECEPLLEWIRSVHESSSWTTSVCTGSLLLAAAGVLDGVPATTHWLAFETLERLGAVPVAERVVEHGKIITAAGVSAGIDMALRLAQKLAGDQIAQAIQLGIEYDPAPPFDCGSPEKAPAEVVELVRASAADVEPQRAVIAAPAQRAAGNHERGRRAAQSAQVDDDTRT